MSLARFSVNNSVLINMAVIVIFIIGIYTIVVIPKEASPAVDFGSASIVVNYPGVSPDEIEYLIVKKIEDQLKNLTLIAGTPKQVIEKLRIYLEETRPSIVALWGNDGQIDH